MSHNHYRLRQLVYEHMRKWDMDGYDVVTALRVLTGRESYFSIDTLMTDKEVRICNDLLGPNGYTIYKMLMARVK